MFVSLCKFSKNCVLLVVAWSHSALKVDLDPENDFSSLSRETTKSKSHHGTGEYVPLQRGNSTNDNWCSTLCNNDNRDQAETINLPSNRIRCHADSLGKLPSVIGLVILSVDSPEARSTPLLRFDEF
jgi:hypothetical protein